MRIWHGHAGAKALTARKEAITNLIPQNLIVLALFAAAALVAGFFAYIYSIKRQTYLLIWTIGWAVYSLHFLGPVLWRWVPEGPSETPLSRWLYALVPMLFFIGAQLYSNRKPWIVPASVAAGVLGLWAIANYLHYLPVSVVVPSACLFLAVAVIFLAGNSATGDSRRPFAGYFFYVLGHPETFAVFVFLIRRGKPANRHERGNRGAFRLRHHAHGHGLV